MLNFLISDTCNLNLEVHTFSSLIFTEKLQNTQERFENCSIHSLTSAHTDMSISGSQKEYETMLY